MSDSALIPAPEIQQRIHLVRGKRVIFDADLARFYAVGTRDLNKAVVRNLDRFPDDFAFMLTLEETRTLMFQAGTSKPGRGGVRKPARVFTEQGVAMLAGVLRSPRAVIMSIAIVRAFVQIRELLAQHRQLAAKLAELESKLQGHDHAITNLFEAIRQLTASAGPRHRRKIGFHQGNRSPGRHLRLAPLFFFDAHPHRPPLPSRRPLGQTLVRRPLQAADSTRTTPAR